MIEYTIIMNAFIVIIYRATCCTVHSPSMLFYYFAIIVLESLLISEIREGKIRFMNVRI